MKMVALETTALSAVDLAKMAKKGLVILTSKGKPLASVKDISGSDWESIALANNPRFVALIEESRRSFRKKEELGLNSCAKNSVCQKTSTDSKKLRGGRPPANPATGKAPDPTRLAQWGSRIFNTMPFLVTDLSPPGQAGWVGQELLAVGRQSVRLASTILDRVGGRPQINSSAERKFLLKIFSALSLVGSTGLTEF